MPISHKHRCIFIHIPKTAGTSILRALSASDEHVAFAGTGLWDVLLNSPDARELVSRYRSVFPVGILARAQQQHLPASILKRLVSSDVWNTYFKFAFVRNPWDMLVSGYHYQTRTLSEGQRAQNPDIYEILERAGSFEGVVRSYPIIRADMTSFLTDDDGRLLVDFVGKYENISADFETIRQRIGLPNELSHENASRHDSYREYYSPDMRAIIEQHFARDIVRFGYSY